MKARIRREALSQSPQFDGEILKAQRGTPGEERLHVYAEGYLVRIREALAEVYEAVRQVLGKQAFARLAAEYASAYPSHDYNLSLAGRHVPAFLRNSSLTQQLPFLPDLARLEWAICHAFHAFEKPSLDLVSVGSLSIDAWEQIRLVFQPSMGLVASSWPILDIWESRKQSRKAVNIDVVDRPQRVLIFRDGLQVRCEGLDELQYQVLDGLVAGQTLGAVCGMLASRIGEQAIPITAWFAGWTKRRLIVECHAAEASR